MRVLKDISYGSHERQKFDIYIPDEPVTDRGVLLFIHGGGWSSCDKAAHLADAEYFCNKGYITASMNYRYVSDNISVFDELDDIVMCLECIKLFSRDNGFEADKVILSGGSAGAHLALLYAYIKKAHSPLSVEAVCAYCPPVKCYSEDFLLGISGEFEDWKYKILSLCCGEGLDKADFNDDIKQKALKRISPAEYVTVECVPTAVFCAKKDELVPVAHIYDFIDLLNSNGVSNELLIYENSGHAMDKDEEASRRARDITESYLRRYF